MRLLLTLTLLFGCVPVSHVIIGDTRESIQPSDVKIYIDYPAKYEKIALIDAGSNFAFKDPEILFTWQGKICLLYTSPSPRDVEESRMPSSA